MFRRRSGGSRSPSMGLSHMFHGVAIRPGAGYRCTAAQALVDARFLSEEAPRLPLVCCDNAVACGCTYRHYHDRRTEMRRECDQGLPMRFHLDEKRSGAGRRITDG